MSYDIKSAVGVALAGLYASDTGATWEATIEEALREAYEAGRQSLRDDQKAIADEMLADLAGPDPHPISSECECGGIAHHAPACRWREGYGSRIVADYRVVQ